MAQTSWPFENIDTTEVQFSQWARHINEGIRPDFANELEPFADDSGLNVKVKSGQAMVRGHYYASTAEETLTITTPDATNPRIDSVVLELDIDANSILLKVVAGTPAGSPVAPTLTQSEDGNVYQFLLGNVAVAAGVFSITAGDVTDLRTYMFQGVGKWTTATRPENPIDYQTIGYNTDLNTHEVWNGTAWTSVFAPITTEGDLAIGDNTGTAVRLPIGPADSVLTSNGTTAVWLEGASGGGQSFVNLEFNVFSIVDVSIPADSVVRFGVISTSTASFSLSLYDSSDNLLDTITLDTDLPFTYATNSTAIAKLAITNDVVDETAILFFSDPTAANAPTEAKEAISIFNSQSITINKTFDAYIFGGGGGGGGGNSSGNTGASGGGGGGAGYFATTTLTAGTYTATIGGGGTQTNSGGTSSINGVTASGGSGGFEGRSNAGNGSGGDGGSGGGAGNRLDGPGGAGGTNGADGNLAADSAGTAGTGSGIALPTSNFFEKDLLPPGSAGGTAQGGGFYAGGTGGNRGTTQGGNATGRAGGGGGGDGNNSSNTNGGQGGGGLILLLEV